MSNSYYVHFPKDPALELALDWAPPAPPLLMLILFDMLIEPLPPPNLRPPKLGLPKPPGPPKPGPYPGGPGGPWKPKPGL